jgi:hypothetical protein
MKISRILVAMALPLATPGGVSAQVVPEGIHSLADGPETICGITGSSAQNFENQVRASPVAKYNNETDRYTTYEGPMAMTLWAFAKPTNFVFPLATCLRIYEKDGAVYAEREMRCDATREQCDKAFLEFDALDAQNRQQIQGKVGG